MKILSKMENYNFVANSSEVLGVIEIFDAIKDTSKDTIDEFKRMNLEVIMLTGDNQKQPKCCKNFRNNKFYS